MKTFKISFKTSEFLTSVFVYIILFMSQFYLSDLTRWSYCLCGIVSSYILARAIFKKNRGAYLGDGFKTSEFYAYAISVVLLLLYVLLKKLSLENGIITISILQSAFNISRGYSKGLNNVVVKNGIMGL